MENVFYKQILFFFFLFYAVIVVGQCPTVTSVNQIFCDADEPKIEDLVANDEGGGIEWYLSSTGGTALTSSINLQDGITYYAESASGLPCVVRESVTVTLYGAPPSNVDVAISKCSSDTNTIDQLNADGTNIEWYTEQNGGVLLSGTTPLVDGTTYWVQQTENSCTSIRLPTTVTIIDPGAPEGDSEQFFCIDPSNLTVYEVGDLIATGNDIAWYDSETSINELDPSTPLVEDAIYYATRSTFPCESTDRLSVTVRFEDSANPGEDGVLDICDNDVSDINLINYLLGSPESGGTWSGPVTITGDQGVLDASLLTFGSYVFKYTIAAQNACPEESAEVTVNVQIEPNAGENNELVICSNDDTIDLFTLIGGSPDTGGTWSPALNSGTGIFDPSIDVSDVYTYSVSPTSPCVTSDSSEITVTVEQAPNTGTDTSIDICENSNQVDLFSLLGSEAMSGGEWSPALNSGTGVFDPSIDISGTYVYSLAPTITCPGDQSTIIVNVDKQLSAGLGASVSLCTNDTTIDLFSLLTHSPDVGGVWSPSLASGTGIFDPAVDIEGDYVYTVGIDDACFIDEATISVTLNTAPNAGSNSSLNFCGDSGLLDLFTFLGVNADNGGTWSGPSELANGDLGTFDPTVNVAGEYIYTVEGLGNCEDDIAIITVAISDLLPTLNINGDQFCFIDDPTISDLISNISLEDNGTLTIYTTASGTTTINDLNELLVDNQTYYITETDIESGCEGTQRLEVTVSINNPEVPILSDDNALFCLIDNPIIGNLNSFIVQGTNIIWINAITGEEYNDTDVLLDGDYYALEEDVYGCRSLFSSIISIVISNNEIPEIIANGNQFCGVDDPLLLDLENNLVIDSSLTVVWYNDENGGEVLSNSIPLVDNNTYYAATFNSTTNCESTERLPVTVDLTICDPEAYTLIIPDGFSPNGDGINDVFEIIDAEFVYEDYIVEIYNRYGTLIYKGGKNDEPWNGTCTESRSFGNKVMPNGVYFYIINFNKDDISPIQGRVYLNR